MYWKQWDIDRVKLMLPFAIVGIILGGALLLLLAENKQDLLMRRILGGFTLLVVLYKVVSDSLKGVNYQPRNWPGWPLVSARH
jgi:uncharacterized membrane protein YfcA